MATRIRVNVSGELIARAKSQAEAARFLRLEQQQLKAAGAQIAAATAQKRQAPSGGRSFWQSRGRRGQQRAEETIATAQRQDAYISFWMEGAGLAISGVQVSLQIKYNGVTLPLYNLSETQAGTKPAAYLLTANDNPYIVEQTRIESSQSLYDWGLRGTNSLIGEYQNIEKLEQFAERTTNKLEFIGTINLDYQIRAYFVWGKLKRYGNAETFVFSYPSGSAAFDITWRKLPIPE